MSQVYNFDISIKCGWLISMKGGKADWQKNQLIGINQNTISYVGNDDIEFTSKKTIAADNKIVLPGLINGHTHLAMNLLRGIGDDQALQTWLEEVIFPIEAKEVNPDFVERGTRMALEELIQGGVTTFCDMYYFADTVAKVADEMGVRGICGEAASDFPAPDNKSQDGSNFRMLENMIEQYKDHGRITPAIAPHAPYTCSDDVLKECLNFAKTNNIPLLIHVSETQHEVNESIKLHGISPLARMEKLGLLKHRCIFAHMVHMHEGDFDRIKNSSIGIVHNPESNMKLGSGVAPIVDFLKAGYPVGLGTDGAASNNNLNMLQEMDTAAKLQKLTLGDNTAMTAGDALNLATYSGAHALGMEKQIGSIEVGKLADIICVETIAPNMQPMHDPVSQIVYSTNGNEVSDVLCHGKILMENNKRLA